LSGHTEGKLVGRFASDDDSLIGTFVDIKVTSVRPFSMQGDLVAVEEPQLGKASLKIKNCR